MRTIQGWKEEFMRTIQVFHRGTSIKTGMHSCSAALLFGTTFEQVAIGITFEQIDTGTTFEQVAIGTTFEHL